jgi:hypothetical protein
MLQFVVCDTRADSDRTVFVLCHRSKLFEPADIHKEIDLSRPQFEEADETLAPGESAGILAAA